MPAFHVLAKLLHRRERRPEVRRGMRQIKQGRYKVWLDPKDGWVVKVADEAQLVIDNLPEKARRQVSKSIAEMKKDPFQGNVKTLQGPQWKGRFRKRVGD